MWTDIKLSHLGDISSQHTTSAYHQQFRLLKFSNIITQSIWVHARTIGIMQYLNRFVIYVIANDCDLKELTNKKEKHICARHQASYCELFNNSTVLSIWLIESPPFSAPAFRYDLAQWWLIPDEKEKLILCVGFLQIASLPFLGRCTKNDIGGSTPTQHKKQLEVCLTLASSEGTYQISEPTGLVAAPSTNSHAAAHPCNWHGIAIKMHKVSNQWWLAEAKHERGT